MPKVNQRTFPVVRCQWLIEISVRSEIDSISTGLPNENKIADVFVQEDISWPSIAITGGSHTNETVMTRIHYIPYISVFGFVMLMVELCDMYCEPREAPWAKAETKWTPFCTQHFQMHLFLDENVRILTKLSMKFVAQGPLNNIPALVKIMAWQRPGTKPLYEPMMVSLLTHICVTQPNELSHWPLKLKNSSSNKVVHRNITFVQ